MAARYWVGGTGTWDATAGTKWALTSGGAGGETVPGTSDTVFFDVASGANVVTVGSGYNPEVVSLTMTGFTGTLAFGNQTIIVNGTGTVYTGATTFTVTGTPVINCTNSSATARTITPTAVTEANAINFNITAGTGNFTITSSNSVKDLNFTGFTGTFTGASHINYGSLTLGTGMTVSDTANIVTFAATSGTHKITCNGVSYTRSMTFNGVGGTWQLQDNCTVGSTRTVTLTNGTLDLNSKTLSCGLFSSTNSNTRSIAFGTGNITLTGSNAVIWTTVTSTGFSYTGIPAVNCTYSGSTGSRTINTGSGLTESNCLSFNVSAGSDTITSGGAGYVFKNLNLTGFSGTFSNTGKTIYGSFTATGTATYTAGANALTFAATSGTQTLTTNGVTLDFPLTFSGIGGTFSFADALTQGSTRAFTITNGTVKLKAGATSTVGSFVTSGTTQKYLQSTLVGSRATLSQVSGTVSVSYLTIKDIAATGGATWNAYRNLNNIDAGNNTGWDFLSTPVTTTSLSMRLGFGL